MGTNDNVTNIRETGEGSKAAELERINIALQTTENSLREVQAQLEADSNKGSSSSDETEGNLRRELDTLRRSKAELERRLRK